MALIGALMFFGGAVLFSIGVLGSLLGHKPSPDGGRLPRANRGGLTPTTSPSTARVMPAMEASQSGAPSMAFGIQGGFQRARLGQTITVNHPKRGPITGKILGTIRYTELWQRVKAPNEPWVPTGNLFTAHWLGNFMIYEWKDSVWLLDEYDALTDQDIATNFLPYAKRYGESNETADVYFAYPPATWKITDIGKFSVQAAEGSGLRLNVGAVGRFIHGSGDGGRALVVEDYQSGGGGQDTAWIGYALNWKDIQRVG
jgi:hypothetical protein